MDLHYLEYIIEIANMHSISRAAENLFITQSTLSQYLSRLESELGVNLFERRRNEMTLTPAGKLYVAACEQMLQQKRELYNQLSDMGQAKTGSFSVGITPQWGAVAYSHIIGKFYESYPNVTVKVMEETASPLIRLLQDGELDMAIIPLTENSSLPLESILLQAEELILAIPKEHAKKLSLQNADGSFPRISIADLKNEPMIFSQSQTTIRKLENQCFAACRVTPKIVAEINSHPASLVMVEQSIGSTFLPISCATTSDRIVYAHAVPTVQWFVVIAFRKGFVLHQSEKYFVSLFQQLFGGPHYTKE
ncbi:LysR family transcriptional regulator [Clostridium sp. AF32-12BH]|mgnify:FL=1|uniref:LysR family transcriptional regulator n=1 Tax=Clostridium sp. AF32-12BH TaxID=2292006 RepID=UPI000E4CCA65|nr:LysR family transcriptional regulator [Clostridium sp. AF32-12BH]RHP42966.1 LysR family transcriptional regulator [Clostridium sp. AF32-12BH]